MISTGAVWGLVTASQCRYARAKHSRSLVTALHGAEGEGGPKWRRTYRSADNVSLIEHLAAAIDSNRALRYVERAMACARAVVRVQQPGDPKSAQVLANEGLRVYSRRARGEGGWLPGWEGLLVAVLSQIFIVAMIGGHEESRNPDTKSMWAAAREGLEVCS